MVGIFFNSCTKGEDKGAKDSQPRMTVQGALTIAMKNEQALTRMNFTCFSARETRVLHDTLLGNSLLLSRFCRSLANDRL